MASLKLEIMDKIVALMTAAFGFVAALAWNGAISALMTDWLGEGGDAPLGLIIYAVIVTAVAVIAIVLISRVYGKIKSKEEAKEAAKAETK
jgi:TRAP-type C4-dicarboxylate transport system permease small subunit